LFPVFEQPIFTDGGCTVKSLVLAVHGKPHVLPFIFMIVMNAISNGPLIPMQSKRFYSLSVKAISTGFPQFYQAPPPLKAIENQGASLSTGFPVLSSPLKAIENQGASLSTGFPFPALSSPLKAIENPGASLSTGFPVLSSPLKAIENQGLLSLLGFQF
jgi:hypothetical protein